MNKCRQKLHKQKGLVIVMLVLVLVVLLAIAALALDLGRLYVLRSEMQNAVDAAALAAAAELNGKDDAITRGDEAATELLDFDSHFANVRALLGPEADLTTEYYSSIGNSVDVAAGNTEGEKIETNDGTQAHYVRVTLNPNVDEESTRYGVDLYFLPVLSAFGITTSQHAVTTTTALAGRHYYFCNYPPVMICDPFEGSGGFLGNDGEYGTADDNVHVGDEILLKLQGGPNSKWSPGTFGFLDLPEGKPPVFDPAGGASELGPKLANEGDLGCTPPQVMPETGQMATPMKRAMNTRFDCTGPNPNPTCGLHYNPGPDFNKINSYQAYPPAENITSYGDPDYEAEADVGCPLPANYCNDNPEKPVCWRDSLVRCPGSETRVGSGDWEREGYWDAHHPPGSAPVNLNSMSRYDVFQYETDNGMIPEQPIFEHQGVASNDRRVLFVAVMSCEAGGLKPNQVFDMVPPDGFAKLFITERVGEAPNTNFFVEFMGWAKEEDANYHVTVQLYE